MIPGARSLALAAVFATSLFGATAVRADDMAAASSTNLAQMRDDLAQVRNDRAEERNAYTQTNLVSDGAVRAPTTDPKLLNAWGVAFFPGGPF